MNIGVWLGLAALATILLPDLFILRKYKEESSSNLSGEKFEAFQFFETIWLIVNLGFFIWQWMVATNYPHRFVLLALVFASITIPLALFSGLTGIYPIRTRSGYYYYIRYKDPAKQFLMSSKYPELKIVGWVQFILLISIIVISSVYFFS
jgi:hypothetical protein